MSIESLNELGARLENALLQARSGISQAISSTLAEILACNEKLEAVGWVQYAPYFNDGDPCIFKVQSMALKVNGEWSFRWKWGWEGELAKIKFRKEIFPNGHELLDKLYSVIREEPFLEVLEVLGEGMWYLNRGESELSYLEYEHE